MGIAKKGLTFVALTFSMALSANAATYIAADDSPESQLCVTAATASKLKMNRAVKDFQPGTSHAEIGKSYRLVANNLYCNGMDVAEFASQAGNKAVADKLQQYRSSDVSIRDIAQVSQGNVYVSGSK